MSRLDKLKIFAEGVKVLYILAAGVGIGIGADIWVNVKKQQYDFYLVIEFFGFLLSIFVFIFLVGLYITIGKDTEGEK